MAKEEKRYLQRRANGTTRSDTSKVHHPWGVVFNSSTCQLVISEHHDNGHLCILDRRNLNRVRPFGQMGFTRPAGLSYQPITNNLLVCDYGSRRVYMMNEKNEALVAIDELRLPVGVACAPSGHFFVTDQSLHKVKLFDASCRFTREFGKCGNEEDDLDNPYGVSVLDRRFSPSSVASSMVLVANHYKQILSLWSADGSQHIKTMDLDSYTRDVCVDLNGFVYVSTHAHKVEVLDPRRDFACLQTIGSWGSAPGQFNYPTGLCVDHTNTLIVADNNNNRLGLFI